MPVSRGIQVFLRSRDIGHGIQTLVALSMTTVTGRKWQGPGNGAQTHERLAGIASRLLSRCGRCDGAEEFGTEGCPGSPGHPPALTYAAPFLCQARRKRYSFPPLSFVGETWSARLLTSACGRAASMGKYLQRWCRILVKTRIVPLPLGA